MENNNIVDLVKQIDEETASLSREIERHKNDLSNPDYYDAYKKRKNTLEDAKKLIEIITSNDDNEKKKKITNEDKERVFQATKLLVSNNADGTTLYAATKIIGRLADSCNIHDKEKPIDFFDEEAEKVKPRRR